MKITEKFIRQGASHNGTSGWNKRQLELLNISWPPVSGWIQALIGQEISEDKALLFIELKGKKKEKTKSTQKTLFGSLVDQIRNNNNSEK